MPAFSFSLGGIRRISFTFLSGLFVMRQETLIGFHGFLGRPTDLYALDISGLSAVDILSEPVLPLQHWAQTFNQKIRSSVGILGYSLGGRLALHCLCEDEKKYSFAIILSANPGFKNPEERALRLVNDKHWAQKFLDDPWDALIAEWDNQPVLRSSVPPVRQEKDFDRTKLSQALTLFSLGHQEDLRTNISQLSIPILWLCPSAEKAQLDGISFKHPQSQIIIVEGSHRFFMESPAKTRGLIVDFLRRLRP